MDFEHSFERFREFMFESAARQDAAAVRHDVEIAAIRESLTSITNTVGRLVDNQVFLHESIEQTQESIELLAKETRQQAAEMRASLRELERIVFRHVSDPGAHKPN